MLVNAKLIAISLKNISISLLNYDYKVVRSQMLIKKDLKQLFRVFLYYSRAAFL